MYVNILIVHIIHLTIGDVIWYNLQHQQILESDVQKLQNQTCSNRIPTLDPERNLENAKQNTEPLGGQNCSGKPMDLAMLTYGASPFVKRRPWPWADPLGRPDSWSADNSKTISSELLPPLPPAWEVCQKESGSSSLVVHMVPNMCINMCMNMYIHMCIYIYTHNYIHIIIYIYTYSQYQVAPHIHRHMHAIFECKSSQLIHALKPTPGVQYTKWIISIHKIMKKNENLPILKSACLLLSHVYLPFKKGHARV